MLDHSDRSLLLASASLDLRQPSLAAATATPSQLIRILDEPRNRFISGGASVTLARFEEARRTVRAKGDAAIYNRAAVKIMKNHGVAINDLYSFALPRLNEIQRQSNVHFTPQGSQQLAERCAKSILKALEDQ